MTEMMTANIEGLTLPAVADLTEYRGCAEEILTWAKSMRITDHNPEAVVAVRTR